MKIFQQETYQVHLVSFIELYIVKFILHIFSASFDVADLHIHAWFRIKVNLDVWEDISPADVSVETVIGNVKYVNFNGIFYFII
jgi:hypothetical protein